MRRKQADPDCVMCKGTGYHAPIIAGLVDPVERQQVLLTLPPKQECGCTFVYETKTVS